MSAEFNDSFDPTIDELRALKRLELETLPVESALKEHLPHRLYDLGLIRKTSEGRLMLTDKGLAVTRRQP